MREDIVSLKQYTCWDLTLEQFGCPVNNKSRVVVECVDCSGQTDVSVRQLKLRLKKKLFSCKNCVTNRSLKKLSEDPEIRKRHAEGCARSYLNPERKAALSSLSKELWEDPEFRARQIKSRKELWKKPGYRKKQKECDLRKHLGIGIIELFFPKPSVCKNCKIIEINDPISVKVFGQ